ncbi:hypothetical protein ACFWDI_28515 [Streptomyces sp. NPDC060064]
MNVYRTIRTWYRDPAYVQAVLLSAASAVVILTATATLRLI